MFARQLKIVRYIHSACLVRPIRLSRSLATLAAVCRTEDGVGANEIDECVGMQEVKSDETFHIPVVDFGKFLKPSGPGDRKATANEIVTAFKEVGYVLSEN